MKRTVLKLLISLFFLILFIPNVFGMEYVCCGGGQDEEGILWEIRGKYDDGQLKECETHENCEDKYCRWYPSINSKTMVITGGGIEIRRDAVLWEGAMEEYARLLRMSKIKYVQRGEEIWITREWFVVR